MKSSKFDIGEREIIFGMGESDDILNFSQSQNLLKNGAYSDFLVFCSLLFVPLGFILSNCKKYTLSISIWLNVFVLLITDAQGLQRIPS